ncbi:polysaccharide deacetylase family protein [Niallia sp. 03133]|uniref:polysaccharide deacetylase family protein n=1 Tax=Niallia sp. 03133 TaxID=3458060 RepID=UPI00404506FA
MANKPTGVCLTFNLDAEFRWLAQYAVVPEASISSLTDIGKKSMEEPLDRILTILAEKKMKCTFFVAGKVAEKYPEQILRIAKEGHEIESYGVGGENYALLAKEKQKELLASSKRTLEDLLGKRVRGFRAPDGEVTQVTLTLAQEIGYDYTSIFYDDYLPYKMLEEQLIEIPSSYSLIDFHYFIANLSPSEPKGQVRIPNYQKVLENWRWELAAFKELQGLAVFQMNSETIGGIGRVQLLISLIEQMEKNEQKHYCCGEIADAMRSG